MQVIIVHRYVCLPKDIHVVESIAQDRLRSWGFNLICWVEGFWPQLDSCILSRDVTCVLLDGWLRPLNPLSWCRCLFSKWLESTGRMTVHRSQVIRHGHDMESQHESTILYKQLVSLILMRCNRCRNFVALPDFFVAAALRSSRWSQVSGRNR